PSHSWQYAALIAGALSLLVDLEAGLVAAPEVRLLEMAVCRDWYRKREPDIIGPPPWSYVPEALCKGDGIQVELAWVRAWKAVAGAVPGYLHETLPTRLVWASAAFQFLGGGNRVLLSLVNTVIVDVAPKEKRINLLREILMTDRFFTREDRTTTFYLIGAAVFLTDILSSLAGAVLLSRDLWLPYKFATPILLLAFPLTLALPETLPQP
ncbi:hypothetical protein K490DRAFT_20326, partial [Saccharata proteae CBS 121410]